MTKGKKSPESDRTPPHDVEAEKAVLGSCLLDEEAYYKTREVGLHSGAFFTDAHRHIYSAMGCVVRDNQAVDGVMLCTQIRNAGLLDQVGGVSYISTLTDAVPTSVNAVKYAETVLECHRRRQVILACSRAATDSYKNRPARHVIADLVTELEHIGSAAARKGIETPADLWPAMEERVEKHGPTAAGMYCGIDDLDNTVRGLRNNQLWVIGGRPSTGKSAFLLTLAQYMTSTYGPALISSLDATKEEVMDRLARIVIPFSEFEDAYVHHDKNELEAMISIYSTRLRELPIYIDDETVYIEDMLYSWRAHLVRHPDTKWIGIDYFQQIQTRQRHRTRLDALNDILAQLKAFRMTTGVPMVLLSQLNRQDWKREEGPQLHHLKDTGTLEQDAHVVMLLSHLDPKDDPPWANGELGRPVRVNVAKQKDGPVRSKVVLRFVPPQYLFLSPRKPRDDKPKQSTIPVNDDGDDTPF